MLFGVKPLQDLLAFGFFAVATCASGQVDVLTFHNDNLRTGLNSNETSLSPSSVSENTFGLLYRLPVDGAIYAQPLAVAQVPVKGMGSKNLIFVATENNSVYAFDGNATSASSPIWHTNLGPSVPNGDTGSGDIQPLIGITGTPVIRITAPGKGYLYVIAKTKETGANGTVYVQRLHALNITNGKEMAGSPVQISASVPGTGDGNDGNGNIPFNSLIQSNRPALLYLNNGKTNNIYIAWASHGDNGAFHGWIMGYDAISLKQVAVFNTTPNAMANQNGGAPAGGGIWQSGGGLTSDGETIFVATGNGVFDPTTNAWGDAVLKLSPGLQVEDYFAPSDQENLDTTDGDLGASGVMVIPSGTSYNPSKQIMVQTTKRGNMYLLDEKNLGRYNASKDNVYQEILGAMGDLWGNPAYYNGTIFYGPASNPVCSFNIANSKLTGGIQMSSSNTYGYPGPTPCVSSNGNSDGIVWAVDSSQYVGNSSGNSGPAQLYAYDASNLSTTLYSTSGSNGRDVMGTAVKFVTPLVQGGRVYVGTQAELDVFGLGNFSPTPLVETKADDIANQVAVSISDKDPSARIVYTLDGSQPSPESKLYTGPLTLTKNATFRTRAFSKNLRGSGVATANVQIAPRAGTGHGLASSYFASNDLSGDPLASELAPTVNYDWNGQKPIGGINDSKWSAVWTGSIQPICSTDYTFFINSDGGDRVWINGMKIIDRWSLNGLRLDASTAIPMEAGKKYSIRIERAQGTGPGLLQFYWSSPGMPRQIVPESQLYDK